MSRRLRNIYAQLQQQNLEGLIVSLAANISYLTEYPSRDSYLLVSEKENIYFTDSRYTQEAKANLGRGIKVVQANASVFKFISDACLTLGLERVGFEARHLAFAEYAKIKEGLNNKVILIPTHSLIEELRETKDAQEVEKIRKATRIASLALEYIENCLLPGKKEIEIVAELEHFIRYNGAHNSAFDIIVASGANSSFPHHIPSERKIKNNEPVLIDIGVDYFGYKSDLTRTFFLGRINPLFRRIYDIVHQAQIRAIKRIKPFECIDEVDKAARQYITRKGYGPFFGHNLGHGIGLDVHEDPHISGKEKSKLRPGMVFTVEPAIYLPKKFGVRIEDMVLVTPETYEVISGSLHK